MVDQSAQVTALLSLAAACSSAGVVVLFAKDTKLCRSPDHLPLMAVFVAPPQKHQYTTTSLLILHYLCLLYPDQMVVLNTDRIETLGAKRRRRISRIAWLL
ncbi:hypothetical protein L1049_015209 [Liquidambar formosana]|uniref:Uncharacterized protein n=1 Tax=Liquidambar formosana TaxID=63359 RepID=A0AAP0S3W5_LIQFO